jgi:hypothetical protein
MPAPLPLPPLDVLTALLAYDPDTGALRWIANRSNQKAGTEAGNIHCSGYRRIRINGREYKANRIAYALHHGLDPYPLEVDHVNRDRDDNRACNLRAVSPLQNRSNSKTPDVPIVLLSPDGLSTVASSMGEAARLLGCHRRTIGRRLKDGRPLPSGHTVRLASQL